MPMNFVRSLIVLRNRIKLNDLTEFFDEELK